jgi:ferredoxin--NADP+ reductase
MFEILEKKVWLAEEPRIVEFLVQAPDIARAHHAGQFVIVIPVEGGERIPLTIADSDAKAGTISLVFQEVGASTIMLGRLEKGQKIPHVAGPLGKPTHIEKFDGAVVCVGGGIGVAPIHPIAKAMKAAGNHVISILGARSKNLMIYEDRMRAASNDVRITTDDGSYGRKGFVTDELKGIIEGGTKVGCAVVIGPPIMMKFTCKVTEPHKIPTFASLNTIMVDGTGMCGACRVTVGGKTKFVCVDGPEFDGHQVDFDEMMARQRQYLPEEKQAKDRCQSGHGTCHTV